MIGQGGQEKPAKVLIIGINYRPELTAVGPYTAGIAEALAQRGVAKDIVRACSSSCLDLCESGISIVQEPEHVAYGGVTLADVNAIADAAAEGEVVERLVVQGLEQYRNEQKRKAG